MPPKHGPRRAAPVLIKLAGTGILGAILVIGIDWSATWETMRGVSVAALLGALAALTAQALTASLRWWWLNSSAGLALSLGRTVRVLYVGLLFNQLLPSAIGGDAARVVQLRRDGMTWPTAFASVAGDRLLGLIALVASAAIGLPALARAPPDGPILALVGMLSLGAWVGILWLLVARGRLPFADALPARMGSIVEVMRRLFGRRRRALGLLVASIAVHGWTVIAMIALAGGLGIAISPWVLAAILPPILLLSALPISLAGWGVRETLMIGALAGFGVAPAAAVALSVTFGLVLAVASLPGLLLWRW